MNGAWGLLQARWQALPPVISALLALVAGLFLAHLLRCLGTRLLKHLRFEAFTARVGLKEFLRKGGATHSALELAGLAVYWGTLAVFACWSSHLLNLKVGSAFSAYVRALAPQAMLALVILALGLAVVSFLANFARTLARNAGSAHACLLAKAIHGVGLAIVIAMAVEELGLGRALFAPMVLMLFGAVVFGVALAFGLGCKDLACRAMESLLRKLREREDGSRGGDLEG